jgi:hypothetical protein
VSIRRILYALFSSSSRRLYLGSLSLFLPSLSRITPPGPASKKNSLSLSLSQPSPPRALARMLLCTAKACLVRHFETSLVPLLSSTVLPANNHNLAAVSMPATGLPLLLLLLLLAARPAEDEATHFGIASNSIQDKNENPEPL